MRSVQTHLTIAIWTQFDITCDILKEKARPCKHGLPNVPSERPKGSFSASKCNGGQRRRPWPASWPVERLTSGVAVQRSPRSVRRRPLAAPPWRW